ncbi:sodium/potassium-transporting ATPase subunit beta-2-like [Tubulanus polymorphus]|uniref:sodium/potassium-transporting ATPase subunit beta-2-like n=1 Tax=Tubulanus polymorphus TaxID=672921 RepID=UPI003DA64FFA
MASEEIEYSEPAKSSSGGRLGACMEYLHNPTDGTYCGRTCKNWGMLGAFYFVFYAGLAAFFAVMIVIFFATVDDNHPTYYGMDSLLKDNPGLGFQPMPNYENTLIRFESGKKGSYKVYTDYLQAFLRQYDQDNIQGENVITCENGKRSSDDPQKVCTFELKDLDPCINKQDFGYNKAEPCVLLKLNKVYGWKPFNGTDVEVECHGENPADIDNIGERLYYPSNKFPSYFFPFLSQVGYRQPLVMVQFKSPEANVLIMVECVAKAPNIIYNKQLKLGSVRFELLVD